MTATTLIVWPLGLLIVVATLVLADVLLVGIGKRRP